MRKKGDLIKTLFRFRLALALLKHQKEHMSSLLRNNNNDDSGALVPFANIKSHNRRHHQPPPIITLMRGRGIDGTGNGDDDEEQNEIKELEDKIR